MAANFKMNEADFIKAINTMIDIRLKEAFEGIIKKARDDLETQLRSELAQIALSVHSAYSFEMLKDTLIIKVDLNQTKLAQLRLKNERRK